MLFCGYALSCRFDQVIFQCLHVYKVIKEGEYKQECAFVEAYGISYVDLSDGIRIYQQWGLERKEQNNSSSPWNWGHWEKRDKGVCL